MDRTVFAACALASLPLAFVVGCNAEPSPPPQMSAPLVLAELQATSPGPYRRDSGAPVAVTSAERQSGLPQLPPADWFPPDTEPARTRARAIEDPTDSALRFVAPEPGDSDSSGVPRAPLRPAPVEPATPLAPLPESSPNAADPIVPPKPLPVHPVPGRSLEKLPPTTGPTSSVPRGAPPWTATSSQSFEMASVAQEAQARVRQGFSLAERNALYLARAEFIGALELVAQANDVRQNTRFYTDALTAGLAALVESGDFVQPRPVGKQLDLARLASGHQTPILKGESLDRLAPMMAAQRYYDYAQQQLAAAAGGEACSSQALFGLAKVNIGIGRSEHTPRLQLNGQSMALYQAALMASSNNFRAANELGVILAHRGEYDRARDLLLHSVRLSPHPSTHRNLAAVYAKLGQPQLSEAAQNEALAMERAGHRRGGPAVQWLDPVAFASTAPASDAVLPPANRPTVLPGAETPQPAVEEPVSTARRSISDWLPWNTRR